ncbi:hypothetical protein SpCBS45565_g03187 [Spizellomyces sp. 'palustris']|nr:hypothetical protein SpCBS45565_g03187 [Spizellomyces sp. 'palustris']
MGATESKLAFRKSVFQLYEQQSIPESNDDFWSNFYRLPETAEDVFNLFAPKDIRRVRDTAVENLETVLRKAVNRLFTFLALTTRPTPDDVRDVLNCIRILTRLLPYVFEVENGELEGKIFWDVENGAQPLGAKLCQAVVQLLFFRGSACVVGSRCPKAPTLKLDVVFSTASGTQGYYWILAGLEANDLANRQEGIAVAVKPPAASRDNINNRTETMRLLLTLISRTIYCPPAKVLKFENRWGNAIVCGLEKKAVVSLLCSMLNTIINYQPVGWVSLPYNHLLFANMEEQLVTLCLQTFVALLDIRPGGMEAQPTQSQDNSRRPSLEHSRRSSTASSSEAQSFSPTAANSGESKREGMRNDFCFYTGKLHRPQDFLLLMDGFCRVLKNPLDAANTYLPGSIKRVNVHVEVLMLFWKLVEHNEKFAHQAMETDKVLVILASVLYFAVEARNDPGTPRNAAQIGLLRMCCFILHILSQDRNFAVQLNSLFDHNTVGAAAKAVPNFTSGTWADFMFLAIHTMVTTPSRSPMATLHEHLLTAMTNVSPFVKALNVTTATKLLSLFNLFSNPAFMLANEHNHKNVFFLLEAFNNILQYQVTGNTHLVYAIVRHKQKFYDLHNLTYEHAVNELNRVRAIRAQKQSGDSQKQPNKSTNEGAEEARSTESLEGSLGNRAPSTTNGDGSNSATGSERRQSESDSAGTDTELSEKAKGKLPAEQSSGPVAGGKDGQVAPINDKGKFQPNQEWFNYWRAHLPLSVILILVDSLGPTIEQMCLDKGINDDKTVLEYLQSGTLVGLLPVPHPIYTRRFHYSDAIRIWFTSYLWGRVFTTSNGMGAGEAARMCPPIWTGTQIKLFVVKVSA